MFCEYLCSVLQKIAIMIITISFDHFDNFKAERVLYFAKHETGPKKALRNYKTVRLSQGLIG